MTSAGAAGERGETSDPIARLAGALARLNGWRGLAAAALLGGLGATAFAPLYLVPVLWIAFPGLLWLLDGASRPGRAFALGWAFGFGHFAVGLYWVGISFTVDAARYGFLAPVAVIALAAGLALFTGLVTAAMQRVGRRGPARLLALAGFWLAAEGLRSTLFGGLPWNLVGSAWAFSEAMIQLVALTGVWGLSLLTVLAAAAPALAAEAPSAGFARRWLAAGLGLLALAAVWTGGTIRLAGAPEIGAASVPDVMLRLVQPSIAQADKWKQELRQDHVARQIAMSRALNPDGSQPSPPISHVIWAETAVPYNLQAMPELQRWLGEAVPPGGLLIAGAPRRDAGRNGKLWNSLHALAPGGEILATYDKVRLVPFGEYVPLRSLFSFSKLTAGRVDFSPGPGRRTLSLPGLPPVSPLICYEIIYPGDMTADTVRPSWLLTITNDAWFGRSSGPYQHFATGRMRAVEEGLPLVRVANSGISAVVDPYGRAWDSLGLDEVGVIDSALPRALDNPTLFAALGNWVLLLLLALTLISWLFFVRK